MNCHHFKSLILAALLALFLPGCVSMSGIFASSQPKNANTLQAGKAISNVPHDMPWPNETWWKAYHDTQLDAFISQTITGNPNLRVAQARVALSQAYTDSMHAEMLPNIGADVSTGREHFTERQFIPPPWAGHSDWNNKATASLAYDLDLWGSKQSQWKSYVDETAASAAEVQQVKLILVTAVVRNYVQLSTEYALRDIAEERLALSQQRLSIARRSLTAGLSTAMAVTEAETPLPMIRAHIESIDQRIALTKNQLAALSGQGPGAGDSIIRPTISLNATVGLPDQLPANLIGRRPDVLAHRWHIEAASQNIDSAKADFYPNINLLAFIGFQALGFGQFISNSAMIGAVGPAISLPIFDGGRRRGNLSAKTAEYDIAVENYNATLVSALQNVSDQLVILQSNVKQRKELEAALALAIRSCTLAQTSYQAGLDNYQHVLDMKTALLTQQEALTHLQAERLDAYAGLMQALGGGAFDEQALDKFSEKTKNQPPVLTQTKAEQTKAEQTATGKNQ